MIMEQLHAHEVLHMMEGNSYSESSLRKAIVDKFGECQHFYACSADDMNVDELRRLAPDVESMRKVYLMTDYCTRLQVDHVPDPYYSGSDGFEQVLDILEDACSGLLKQLIK